MIGTTNFYETSQFTQSRDGLFNACRDGAPIYSSVQQDGMRALSQREIYRHQYKMHFGLTEEQMQKREAKQKLIHWHCVTGIPFSKAEPL